MKEHLFFMRLILSAKDLFGRFKRWAKIIYFEFLPLASNEAHRKLPEKLLKGDLSHSQIARWKVEWTWLVSLYSWTGSI